MTFSRTVTETSDEHDDPRPSFPAPAGKKVVETDGELLSEETRPLAKCVPITRALRRVG